MTLSYPTICLSVLALILAVAAPAHANLISNGSFEDGPIETGISHIDTLPSWTLSNTDWAWYMTNGAGYGTAQEGTAFINVTSPSLSQDFAVTAGNTYTVSYYEALRGDGAGQPDTLKATITLAVGNATGITSQFANNPFTNNSGNPQWQQFTFAFTPETSTTATLRFSLNNGDGYPVLDNVVVTGVPEPATLILFGLGAIGLFAVARRRK